MGTIRPSDVCGSQPEGVHMEKQLFSEGVLGQEFGVRQRGVYAALQRWDPDVLLNTPTQDLVAELVDQLGLKPLQLHIDQMEQLPTRDEWIDISQDRNRYVADRSRSFFVTGSSISVVIPFDGDRKLFTLRASTSSSNPPKGDLRVKELVLTYTAVEPTGEEVKAFFDRELNEIHRLVEFTNNDVASFTQQFLKLAQGAVEDRKAKLLADRGLEGALGIPVRRHPDSPARPVPVTRKRLGLQRSRRPTRTAEPYRDEPMLDQAHYEEILEIIQAMGRMLERSPEIFVKLNEEGLRDHILLQLNGTYEGHAGGELFNGAGKTDILVRVDDRNVFIGECKIWRGEKAFADAVDQLLRYMVWRDTKAALVLFIRQPNATAVIGKANAALRTHANFKRPGPISPDPQLCRHYVLHQTDDSNREIHLAVLPLIISQPKTNKEQP
jgi:hypothetical protein